MNKKYFTKKEIIIRRLKFYDSSRIYLKPFYICQYPVSSLYNILLMLVYELLDVCTGLVPDKQTIKEDATNGKLFCECRKIWMTNQFHHIINHNPFFFILILYCSFRLCCYIFGLCLFRGEEHFVLRTVIIIVKFFRNSIFKKLFIQFTDINHSIRVRLVIICSSEDADLKRIVQRFMFSSQS